MMNGALRQEEVFSCAFLSLTMASLRNPWETPKLMFRDKILPSALLDGTVKKGACGLQP